MRLGIFGGTFDPPHIGHLILASEAHWQLNLDHVLWVLTPYPPHKKEQSITPVEIRIQLVKKAISGNSSFTLSNVDILRPAPHYSVDTVRLLRQKYPESFLIYLMGSDSLADLMDWHTPEAFVEECNEIGVIGRPGEHPDLSKFEMQYPGLTEKVRWVDAPLLEISSTGIRQRVARGLPYKYFLHRKVYTAIETLGLYQA